jgi:nitroreductase
MDTHAALRGRRTIHRFRPGEVPAALLDRALEAAHHAPCHRRTWPWRFHVLGEATREALLPVLLDEKRRKGPLEDEQAEAIARQFRAPGAMVMVVQQLDPRPDVAVEDAAAVAAAVENLQLSLWADGVGSKWGTGGLVRAPATRTILGLAENEVATALLWIGWPAEVPDVERPCWSDHVVRHG